VRQRDPSLDLDTGLLMPRRGAVRVVVEARRASREDASLVLHEVACIDDAQALRLGRRLAEVVEYPDAAMRCGSREFLVVETVVAEPGPDQERGIALRGEDGVLSGMGVSWRSTRITPRDEDGRRHVDELVERLMSTGWSS
jgi:hypothetical protein